MKKPKYIFLVEKFEDHPQYCRVPIFFGGERQIHIMQPMYDDTGKGVAPNPQNFEEWSKLYLKHGQIVFSLEAVEEFIRTLRKFKKKLEETNPK